MSNQIRHEMRLEEINRAKQRWSKQPKDMTEAEMVEEISYLRSHLTNLRKTHGALRIKFETVKAALKPVVISAFTSYEQESVSALCEEDPRSS